MRIPVHVLNAEVSPGVKRGGAVNLVTHTVEVMCSADAIPESIDVDISELEINYSKHLNEIELPSHVRVIGRADQTLVTIVPPSGYAEELKAQAEAAAAAAAAARSSSCGVAPGAGRGSGRSAGRCPGRDAGGRCSGGEEVTAAARAPSPQKP